MLLVLTISHNARLSPLPVWPQVLSATMDWVMPGIASASLPSISLCCEISAPGEPIAALPCATGPTKLSASSILQNTRLSPSSNSLQSFSTSNA